MLPLGELVENLWPAAAMWSLVLLFLAVEINNRQLRNQPEAD